jgi:hypothetical protein
MTNHRGATLDRHTERLMSALRACQRTFGERADPPEASATGSSLRLSRSNAVALDLPIAEMVADFLAGRLFLPSGLRASIACTMQEAVLNAVLHGNLAITDKSRGACAAAEDLGREIEARLADPAVAARRCEIRIRWTAAAIVVRVSDEGAGFVPAALRADPALPHGRGIAIIMALTAGARWTCGGRSLLMRFAR